MIPGPAPKRTCGTESEPMEDDMRIVDQRRTVLHKGTEFKKCCFFTIFGMALSWLLHCVRIAAMVYLYCEYQADLLGTVILLTLLSSGTDVGFFFLWKSLITQLSYLLGSYRIKVRRFMQ